MRLFLGPGMFPACSLGSFFGCRCSSGRVPGTKEIASDPTRDLDASRVPLCKYFQSFQNIKIYRLISRPHSGFFPEILLVDILRY